MSRKMGTLLAALLLAACAPRVDGPTADEAVAPVPTPPLPIGDTSRTSLDWAGTYEGTVPCADCEGIRTAVTLREDGSFERRRLFLGRSGAPFTDAGTFVWDTTGGIVTLQSAGGPRQHYRVGENRLFLLDDSGNRIEGELAARHVLEKLVP